MTPARFVELLRELGGKVRLNPAGEVEVGGSTRFLAFLATRLATLDRAALRAYLASEQDLKQDLKRERRFTCSTCDRRFYTADAGDPCFLCRRRKTEDGAGPESRARQARVP